MKAIVWNAYGAPDVLQLAEVEKVAPKDNEVLIRVHATTVTAGDCEVRSFKVPGWVWLPMRLYMGLRKPRIKILGQELAGEVEAVGKDITRFKVGDAVFGTTGLQLGSYAEYKCLPEASDMCTIAHKPINLSYEEAAAIPIGGLNALHFMRKAKIEPGKRVLINGAGGSIGTLAVQIAKLWGAEVIAVDSTSKLDMLRSIGADHVIDYTQEDFTRNGQTYDVIFDIPGKTSYARSIQSLTKNGIYLLGNPTITGMLRGAWTSATTSKTVVSSTASETLEDLLFLKDLIELGQLKPVIDRRYPLEEMVEAHRYVETGQKIGSLIITV